MFGVALLVGIAACSEGPVTPGTDDALMLSVQPSGGSVGVGVGSEVVVTFDHALGAGMEAYVALHEGSLQGPVVEGTWEMSSERTALTFKPKAPLRRATTYVIHLGGGMSAANGHRVNLGVHGMAMGGQWATGSMMGGMSGGMGMGSVGAGMMGSGWKHPSNGSYGMAFTFTTAV